MRLPEHYYFNIYGSMMQTIQNLSTVVEAIQLALGALANYHRQCHYLCAFCHDFGVEIRTGAQQAVITKQFI